MTTVTQTPAGFVFDEDAPPPPPRNAGPGRAPTWTSDDVQNAIATLERVGYVAFRAPDKEMAGKLSKRLSSSIMRSAWWTPKLGEHLPRFTSGQAREIDGQWWGYVVVTTNFVNATGSESDERGVPVRSPRPRRKGGSA